MCVGERRSVEGSTRYSPFTFCAGKTGWPLADLRLHFCALIQAFGLSLLLRLTPLWGLPPARGLWANHALSARLLSKPAVRHLVQEYPSFYQWCRSNFKEVISRTGSALCAPPPSWCITHRCVAGSLRLCFLGARVPQPCGKKFYNQVSLENFWKFILYS